ncbi:MAG: hypothetical protein AB2693_31365, partial [Candidatus Thiodiazotropha sp.]
KRGPDIWIISIFHGCVVWIEKSVTPVTSASQGLPSDAEVILSDRFFNLHHTPMTDTFSCTPRFLLNEELVKMRNFSARDVPI